MSIDKHGNIHGADDGKFQRKQQSDDEVSLSADLNAAADHTDEHFFDKYENEFADFNERVAHGEALGDGGVELTEEARELAIAEARARVAREDKEARQRALQRAGIFDNRHVRDESTVSLMPGDELA